MLILASDIFTNFIDLSKNALLLFGLVFVYGITKFNPNTNKLGQKIISGIAIGLISIFVMMSSWESQAGIFFDSRSVLFGITGLIFSPITTVIAAAIGMTYRAIIAGNGIISGLLTILLTAGAGMLWRYIRPRVKKIKLPRFFELLIFGTLIHIITLCCFLTIIPWPSGLDIIPNTLLPMLGIYPHVTVGLAFAIDYQTKRINSDAILRQNNILLQASVDATKTMEIYALNCDYEYLSFNAFHRQSMKRYYDVNIASGKNFLDFIDNEALKERMKNNIDKAFTGESIVKVIEVETTPGKYLEETYTPIYNDSGIVTGVTIFSHDVTERKKYEESILFMGYHDVLTGLYNRRYLVEKMKVYDNDSTRLPLTVIIADINGLKIMNDAFGHTSGDVLLRTYAKILQNGFSSKGIVARMGGDEFMVLLPNTLKDEANDLIDKVTLEVDKVIINGMHVSISYGVATKIKNEPIEEITRLAEEDMYKHKLFEVSSQRSESIKKILSTLHEKNPREEAHSTRVSMICKKIGLALGMKGDELKSLRAISNLHDIGKIAIDSTILNKPGALDAKEWEIIKKHPEIGYRIIASSHEYAEIANDILCHHERYDGKGYPQGLVGDNIPIRARIIAIADSFDAMISERPYRKPLSLEAAIEELKRNSGTQFDPDIVEVFLHLYKNNELENEIKTN